MARIVISALLFLFLLPQAHPPAAFLSYRAAKDHKLNADPNSKFWRDARGIELDRSILGQPDPSVASHARSRWTKRYLYFLFWGPYDKLHLNPHPQTQHDTQRLWVHDDFELYLGSNFQNINLYDEFEISPQDEFLDMAIDATRARPGWNDEYLWNSGMTVKSRIDTEKKIWYGEMRVPLTAVDRRPAAVGNEFRVNVYRLQHADRGRGHFLAWQPTGEWMPHHPEKFGILKLVRKP
ncbi:MAG TPA: carbohydrate-binding family 9-like protein [Candidatus Acidoferrales bacterium]|nr:carbohydrate-binding family 9-like protein [Candidatus Acidoferrales bacterium]